MTPTEAATLVFQRTAKWIPKDGPDTFTLREVCTLITNELVSVAQELQTYIPPPPPPNPFKVDEKDVDKLLAFVSKHPNSAHTK